MRHVCWELENESKKKSFRLHRETKREIQRSNDAQLIIFEITVRLQNVVLRVHISNFEFLLHYYD